MAVTESTLPVGDTGEKLDTTKVTQTDGTVAHREAVVIADPIENDQRLQLEEYQFANEKRYAAPVTGVELRAICEHMRALIEGQRLTNVILNRLIGEDLSVDDLENY